MTTPDTLDTSGYTIMRVPAFDDGTITGSITSGTNTLTVSSGTNFLVNNWISIAGTSCAAKTNPWGGTYDWCRITAVAGNTITLANNVTATVSGAAVTWMLYTIQYRSNPANASPLGFGTVWRWQQGYKGKWYAVTDESNSLAGMEIHGRVVDSGAHCSGARRAP